MASDGIDVLSKLQDQAKKRGLLRPTLQEPVHIPEASTTPRGGRGTLLARSGAGIATPRSAVPEKSPSARPRSLGPLAPPVSTRKDSDPSPAPRKAHPRVREDFFNEFLAEDAKQNRAKISAGGFGSYRSGGVSGSTIASEPERTAKRIPADVISATEDAVASFATKGSQLIKCFNSAVFSIGQTIRIGHGLANEEFGVIVGNRGSLVLDSPLKQDHNYGEIVEVVDPATAAQAMVDRATKEAKAAAVERTVEDPLHRQETTTLPEKQAKEEEQPTKEEEEEEEEALPKVSRSSILQKVTFVNHALLGPPEPRDDEVIVDLAELEFIQGDKQIYEAGGVSGKIYKWLGILDNEYFPEDVYNDCYESGYSKFFSYDGGKKVIHTITPDFRWNPSAERHEAVEELSWSYNSMLAEFAKSSVRRLRFQPIASGPYAGHLRSQLPEITAEAMHLGFIKLDDNVKKSIRDASSLEMCIIDPKDTASWEKAFLTF
eukprot:TRINITY_DN27092_c0_g1_i1.p1 TRINITY_DN27092_c0_g1~~TRINITY_DN27092_c0_g1_i1.p1  ORF type:complete len:489 (+),score=85.27 TRINITY_DN27092_c0_g1_i1:44-1510(+)